MTHYAMGLSHAALGAFAEARASIEKAVRLAPWIALLRGVLAGLLTHDGEVQRAAEILEGPGTTAMGMVLCRCFAGNIDGAIEAYSDAIEQRDTFAPLLASAVFFKPLRESPRWPTLARKMNLPEEIS